MIQNDVAVGKENISIVLCNHTFVVNFSFIILLFLLFCEQTNNFVMVNI